MNQQEIFDHLQNEFGSEDVIAFRDPMKDQQEEITRMEEEIEELDDEDEKKKKKRKLDRKKDDLGYSDAWIEVSHEAIHEICDHLKNNDELAFDYLKCLSGMDWSERDSVEGDDLGIVYHLYSMEHTHEVCIKIHIPRENPVIDTVSDIWGGANWHEREAFDMFGIKFEGHPYLKRMFCPEDWEGHPLRKDYEVQKYYKNIRVPY